MHRFLSVCPVSLDQNSRPGSNLFHTVAGMFPTLDQQLYLLNKHADTIPIAMYNLMKPEPSQLDMNSRRRLGSLSSTSHIHTKQIVGLHIASLYKFTFCKYWKLQGAIMDIETTWGSSI